MSRPATRGAADGRSLEVSIWRGTGEGAFRTYTVPFNANQTVLDVVSHVQRHLDPTLAYRFACRVGMCGTCAMMVDGMPRWTCRTQVGGTAIDATLELAPLRNLPVIRDLVVDMAPFFDKWRRAEGMFVPAQCDGEHFALVVPSSKMRRRADAGIECIGCAICYAACDVVGWLPDYLGPAALNRAWTLVNDVRDGAHASRLRAIAGTGGCYSCHTHQSCTKACPKGISPTIAIAGLKRAAAAAALRGEL